MVSLVLTQYTYVELNRWYSCVTGGWNLASLNFSIEVHIKPLISCLDFLPFFSCFICTFEPSHIPIFARPDLTLCLPIYNLMNYHCDSTFWSNPVIQPCDSTLSSNPVIPMCDSALWSNPVTRHCDQTLWSNLWSAPVIKPFYSNHVIELSGQIIGSNPVIKSCDPALWSNQVTLNIPVIQPYIRPLFIVSHFLSIISCFSLQASFIL